MRRPSADQIDPDAKLSYQDEFVAGFEYEALPDTNVGVRYIHRNVGRVLEDIADAPAVAYDLGLPGLELGRVHPDQPDSSFPDPLSGAGRGVRGSRAQSTTRSSSPLTAASRTTGRCGQLPLVAALGTFEGFYREDNGQSDPGITSLYDFPTNDPCSPPSACRSSATGATSASWARSVRARCRSIGRTRSRCPAPTRSLGLAFGAGLNLSSGKPLTALAALAAYDNDSEIPLTPRGEGFETFEGFKERTPFETQLDLQASYALTMAAAG